MVLFGLYLSTTGGLAWLCANFSGACLRTPPSPTSLHPAPLPLLTAPPPFTEHTLAELMKIPSHFVLNASPFAWTAIISAWNSPVDTVRRMIKAVLAQTHAPNEVWLSVFDTSKEDEVCMAHRVHCHRFVTLAGEAASAIASDSRLNLCMHRI